MRGTPSAGAVRGCAGLRPTTGGDHPYVDTVRRYLAARDARDSDALRPILADHPRIWFGTKEGPGHELDATGRGPWAAWDELFRSESEVIEIRVDGTTARAEMREINDWFRLVERPASRYYITFGFDHAGRIESKLIHAIPDRPKPEDRLAPPR